MSVEESLSSITLEEKAQWPVNKVRQTFIDYFEQQKEHAMWPSSPVVPLNDPTLLFANAGMNQFKSIFLGTCDPSEAKYKLKRAVNSQKCIRAGGKHNDLEDVGKDTYHHTFFEMLGNWSFGDFFKKEAIDWAYDCLVNVYGLDPERLYATYFGGDKNEGLEADLEARDLWLRYLPKERVIACSMKDNFWEMGNVGPCGPCSEVHYDRIGGRDASARVNADFPDVIEIWNLVFMQYNREADRSLKLLAAQHVDTGMGLERITSILQDKQSNYDTDAFTPIFEAIQRVCALPEDRGYTGLLGDEDVDKKDIAYRVIADHIRTLTFAITDGAVPSSDGRGYVLRRILRRAVRYGQEILNAPAGFFTELVPTVVERFSCFFPELSGKQAYVMSVISDEERSFNRTLDSGVKHFKKVCDTLKAQNCKVFSAKDAHLLFGSMGFPLDLTQLMAEEAGLTVDTEGFEALMAHDRKLSEMAEAARKGGAGVDMTMQAEQTSWLLERNIPLTDSDSKYEWHIQPTATVVALFTGRGGSGAGFVDSVSVAEQGDKLVGVVLDRTPFYYESGGQVYDTGMLKIGDDLALTVINTQTYGGFVLHVGTLNDVASLTLGQEVTCHVDYERRGLVAPNHTLTHVLNYALRKVLLGSDVDGAAGTTASAQCDQKGSLVDAEKMRFDFAWGAALTAEQLSEVEKLVQKVISDKMPVYAQKVPLKEAFEISGLRAIFGETYPDPVRVISVGNSVDALLASPKEDKWKNYSIEFCGGTHLTNTNQAVDFVIVEEGGIAKGIRRITGLTKSAALASRIVADALMARLDEMLTMEGGAELMSKAKAIKLEIDQAQVSLVTKDVMRSKQNILADTLKKWEKAREASRTTAAVDLAQTLAEASLSKNEPFIVAHMDFGADGKIAKKVQDHVKSVNPAASVFLASAGDAGDKLGMFASVSKEHLKAGATHGALTAKEWNDFVIGKLGKGKGGGKPDTANANVPTTAAELESDKAAVLSAAQQYIDSKKL